MKITFVLPTVNMSGGIRVVAIYAKALCDRGHEVHLVSPPSKPTPWWPRFRSPGWRKNGLSKSHLNGLGLQHKIIEKWRPIVDADVPDADVVIATWWETAEWVSRLSPSKGAKVYFVQHHEVFPWLPVERCHATYRLPMQKIVVAKWLADVMELQYEDPNSILVPNAVDHSLFHAPPRGKQVQPTVGFLYSSAHFKGVDTTLRAIEILRARYPALKVLSFGSERIRPEISRDIDFSFDPPQDYLREIYSQCDVWMTASRSEGFNLPAMEAMACRTPVVSTRAGWPAESIDGSNGQLVDIEDELGLAAAVGRIIELPDGQWRSLSEAALSTVERSNWERSSKIFEEALQTTLKSASRK